MENAEHWLAHLTDEMRAQDEEILASIIAGGIASKRVVLPNFNQHRAGVCADNRTIIQRVLTGSANGFGVRPTMKADKGPCCAVGAGILFKTTLGQHDPIGAFARIYGVSIDYASSVSHGFEDTFLSKYYDGMDEYRGKCVGRAAYAFFCTELETPIEGGEVTR